MTNTFSVYMSEESWTETTYTFSTEYVKVSVHLSLKAALERARKEQHKATQRYKDLKTPVVQIFRVVDDNGNVTLLS